MMKIMLSRHFFWIMVAAALLGAAYIFIDYVRFSIAQFPPLHRPAVLRLAAGLGLLCFSGIVGFALWRNQADDDATGKAGRLTEEQMKAALKEKEVLLKEIHHRVKNNLQIVSSLLNLQADAIHDEETRALLRESRNRIRSMALIHEKLYSTHDLSRVDLGQYLRSLTSDLFKSFAADARRLSLHVKVDRIFLHVDTAIPCGLIVNELVSNALKHAFPDGRPGEVTVEARRLAGKRLLLRVADNGIGAEDAAAGKKATLGLQLVENLTRQLHGQLSVVRQGGTDYRIECTAPEEGQV